MNSKGEPSKEEIRKLLHVAFPSVSERKDLTQLTHEECVSMRAQLPGLSEQDLPFYLRQILDDLLFSHTGLLGDSQDVESVVRWLDVSRRWVDLKAIREIYGEKELEKTLEDENILKQANQRAFASFTKTQARAICKWLENAKTWPEMKLYERDLDSALSYWQSRSKSS